MPIIKIVHFGGEGLDFHCSYLNLKIMKFDELKVH
jgi:hypothetical protein